MSTPLNREELLELKSFLAERMVDNMTTKDLEAYVLDDLFQYFDKQGEHEFLEEARNYWDDMFDEAVESVREFIPAKKDFNM